MHLPKELSPAPETRRAYVLNFRQSATDFEKGWSRSLSSSSSVGVVVIVVMVVVVFVVVVLAVIAWSW